MQCIFPNTFELNLTTRSQLTHIEHMAFQATDCVSASEYQSISDVFFSRLSHTSDRTNPILINPVVTQPAMQPLCNNLIKMSCLHVLHLYARKHDPKCSFVIKIHFPVFCKCNCSDCVLGSEHFQNMTYNSILCRHKQSTEAAADAAAASAHTMLPVQIWCEALGLVQSFLFRVICSDPNHVSVFNCCCSVLSLINRLSSLLLFFSLTQ